MTKRAEVPSRPTQLDVARAAGVSRALVSLVMRDAPNVAADTRERVRAAAVELGYRPNAFARSLASKGTRTLGVYIYDTTNPHFANLFTSLAAAAERASFDVLVSPGTRSAARESALINTLLEHQVAGLALLSPSMKETTLRELGSSVPTVVVGRETTSTGIDVVTTDEYAAARLILRHLRDLGHQEIVHISGGNDTRPGLDRAAAYRQVMRELGLTPVVVPGGFTPEGGREGAAAALALPRRPTALAAANDQAAVGALGYLRTLGLDVPGQISVVGFDDAQIAQLELVGLTTIDQRIERFGEVAMALLDERITGGRDSSRIERIDPRLVVRATTGPASHRSASAS